MVLAYSQSSLFVAKRVSGSNSVFLEVIVKARRIPGIKLTLPRKSLTRLSDDYVMLM